MQRNKQHFQTAAQLYAESKGIKPAKVYRSNRIDSFWEAYNSSRCKTAMLCISIIVATGFIVSECSGNHSVKLYQSMIILLGYWMGRTSKAKENRLKERMTHE